MAVNKIVYNARVLIDLTGDSVAADKLLAGVTVTSATVYTGSGAPDASLGADGDIYLDMG